MLCVVVFPAASAVARALTARTLSWAWRRQARMLCVVAFSTASARLAP